MTAPGSRTPVSALREAARLRVQATSLRKTAREIGLSPTGLQGFLDGTEPYAPTIQKLLEWHVREESRKGMELGADTADAALSLLVRHLPEPRRSEAVRAMLDLIRAKGTGEPVPPWLRELLDGGPGGEGEREDGEDDGGAPTPPPPPA